MYHKFHPSPATKTITVAIPDGESVVLGSKQVKDLQENITLEGDKIKGTSKYLTEFNDYSQGANGNFICIKVDEATKKETVKVKVTGTGKTTPEKTLDEDGLLIVKVENIDNKIILTNGNTTKTLILTDLTLKTSEME